MLETESFFNDMVGVSMMKGAFLMMKGVCF